MDRKIGLIENIVKLFRIKDILSSDRRVIASCNLVVALKHSGYFAMLPENLDLEAHIGMYPLTNYKFRLINNEIKSVNNFGTFGSKFDIEGLIHIIDLLNLIPASNKDSITEDGFVSINAKYISNYIKDYKCYLDYLIDTGILISDNQYLVGEKSIGYKLAPNYEASKLVRYNYRRFTNHIPQAIQEERYAFINAQFEENPLLNYPYLTYWYNQKKLVIDKQNAENYAYSLMQEKFRLGYNSWDKNRDKWDAKKNDFCRKHPGTQYAAIMRNINHLDINNYNAMIDGNVHRLHSVITNMQKDYRNFLSYDGQQLVSIDIKNSQPYLSCILFNPDFWDADSSSYLRLIQLPENIVSLINFTPPIERRASILDSLEGFFNHLNENEFDLFRNIVSTGNLYETIMGWIQEERGEIIKRDDVKIIIFKLFFSSNREDKSDANHWLMVYFREKFPQVAEVFRIIKRQYRGLNVKKQYGRLACLLQSIESEIILHRCCKRIWDEKPKEVPVFTIHDSIATTVEHQDYVKSVMEDELTQCIGIRPTLSVESWLPSNLVNVQIV